MAPRPLPLVTHGKKPDADSAETRSRPKGQTPGTDEPSRSHRKVTNSYSIKIAGGLQATCRPAFQIAIDEGEKNRFG